MTGADEAPAPRSTPGLSHGRTSDGPDGRTSETAVGAVRVVVPREREPIGLAEEVAAVVLAVPGVVRLHGGPFGGLGTYLPGHRVVGVRLGEEGTDVHVVVSDLVPVPRTAGRVQRAVSAIASMPVRVHVEDIEITS